MLKRLLSVVLSLCLVLLMQIPCFAAEISDESLNEVKNRLVKAIQNYESRIDLNDLNLQVEMYSDDYSPEYLRLIDLADEVIAEYGSYVLGRFKEHYCSVSYVTVPSEGNNDPYANGKNDVTGAVITYESYGSEIGEIDVELFEDVKNKVPQTYDEVIKSIDKNLSDVEKALLLYDYIIVASNYPDNIGYDEGGFELFENKYYSEMNVFYEGISVCEGNARAYASLLAGVGIDAVTVMSDDMNHTWAMLKIDGNWYHADSTWDDPRYSDGKTSLGDYNEDIWDLGAVSHKYFLKSDEEMKELDHYGWDISKNYASTEITETPVADKSGNWDDAFFSATTQGGFDTAFNYVDGVWYFLDAVQQRVVSYENGEYFYPTFGTEIKYLFSDSKQLYICTAEKIYSLIPSTGKKNVVMSANSFGDGAFISEMRVANGKLDAVILIPEGPDGTYNSEEFSVMVSDLQHSESETTEETTTTSAGLDETDTDATPKTPVDSIILYVLITGGVLLIVVITLVLVRRKIKSKEQK